MSTLEVDESAWPSGRELRRLTKLATEAHGGGSFGDLLEEVYTVVFSVAVAVAVAFGATATLNTKLRPSTAATTLDPAWLALAAGVVALGVGIGLAGRLGPLGVGGGQAAWWLPTPADRRGLLRPRLLLLVVVSVAVGAGLGALVATLGGGSAAAPAAAAGAALGPVAVLAVARTQVAGLGRSVHPAVVVGESLTVAAPLLALLVVLLDPGAPPAVPVAALVAGGVVLALVAVLLLVDTDRRLDAISGAELRARGAVTAYAAGAVTSLDTRELGRALTITAQRDARSRSVDLAWVRGPVSALVTGDAVLTLRSRRHVIAVVVWALVPVVVTLAGWPGWAVAAALIGSGYAAALATTEGARRAEMAPVLDRVFAIEASQVRRVRLVWPAAVMTLWTLVVVGAWAALSGLDVLTWLPLALVAGPVLAAGAVRGAYRKPTDWSKPLVANPMGPPIPPGLLGTVSKGPDVVVICLIPLVLGLVAVAEPAVLLMWQVAATAIAVAIATHVPDPNGLFAQAAEGRRP